MYTEGKKEIKTVIFDLDGVIVSTDDCHYEAWKRLADEENIFFNREINERLRGVSRMKSLEIILERATVAYTEEQRQEFAKRKNEYYKELIKKLTPDNILPGVSKLIGDLKERGIRIAIGSSSRNTPLILERIGLSNYFDAIVDGNSITYSKPNPEVFIKASLLLGIPADNCLVIEDADAGIEAAIAAGMRVLGVGGASDNKYATFNVTDLSMISVEDILAI